MCTVHFRLYCKYQVVVLPVLSDRKMWGECTVSDEGSSFCDRRTNVVGPCPKGDIYPLYRYVKNTATLFLYPFPLMIVKEFYISLLF